MTKVLELGGGKRRRVFAVKEARVSKRCTYQPRRGEPA